MSATQDVRAVTPPEVAARKGGALLVCLTAYFPAAEHVFGNAPKAVTGEDAA